MFIIEIEKSTLKFIWKHKKLRIAKKILNKRSNIGGITILDSCNNKKQPGTGTKTDTKINGTEYKTQV
jgi:hypothetical protein